MAFLELQNCGRCKLVWKSATLRLKKKKKISFDFFSVDSFGTRWVWVNDDRIYIHRWITPLTGYISSVHLQNRRHLDSMWSWAQIAASVQPISRCETDRLWPHRSSTDMNDSRATFYPLRRSSRFWFSGCAIEFTITTCYLSRPPSQGATIQRRPRTTCKLGVFRSEISELW